MSRIAYALTAAFAYVLAAGQASAGDVCNACPPPTAIPEPGTIALLAAGVAGVVIARRYPRAGRLVALAAVVAAAATQFAVASACCN